MDERSKEPESTRTDKERYISRLLQCWVISMYMRWDIAYTVQIRQNEIAKNMVNDRKTSLGRNVNWAQQGKCT